MAGPPVFAKLGAKLASYYLVLRLLIQSFFNRIGRSACFPSMYICVDRWVADPKCLDSWTALCLDVYLAGARGRSLDRRAAHLGLWGRQIPEP